jgi:uncharacterized RDD family membrane protein YckC
MTDESTTATPESDAATPDVPTVETIPVEARPYQGQRAGIVTRVIANIIDLGIVVAVLVSAYVTVAATMFVLDPRSFTMPSAPPLVTIILIGMWVQGVYFTLTWCTTGRTYGDHLMGLRVVNFRGRRMSFIGASLRAALCVVFPVGLFWIVVSHGNRSVQDVAFRTSVIHDWKPHHTD